MILKSKFSPPFHAIKFAHFTSPLKDDLSLEKNGCVDWQILPRATLGIHFSVTTSDFGPSFVAGAIDSMMI